MYTPEEVDLLKSEYSALPSLETVERLAAALGKPKRSIIGKLSRLGIYEKTRYTSKTGELPVTKRELVARLANRLEIPLEKIEGLEKAPKAAIKYLIDSLD
jgi:hypothetical protein